MPLGSGAPLLGAHERSRSALVATLATLILQSLVILQAALAYRQQFFTVSQIRAVHISQGLPFVWHFGMWSDFFIISPLAAYLIGCYFDQWRVRRALLSLLIGLICAALLGWLYAMSPMPEAHMQNHRLTAAGVVHLLYASAVISVSAQFFLFTVDVPRRLLLQVSILLLLHVFVGTHMVLGFLAYFVTLDWYPGQPTKSVAGWVTIVALAAFMFCRYAMLVPRLSKIPRTAWRWLAQFVQWTEGNVLSPVEQGDSPLGLLTFWDSIGSRVLEFGFFGSAAWVFWTRQACSAEAPVEFTAIFGCPLSTILACTLVVVFGVVYTLSRHSAKVELNLVPMVFPRGQVPVEWTGKRDPLLITLSVVGYFSLYLALASFAYDVRFVSFLMLAIASIDYNTRRLVGIRFKAFFKDAKFDPIETDADGAKVARSRAAVKRHLFENPHERKELWRIVGCAISFGVAITGYVLHLEWVKSVSYIALLFTLVVNELLTLKWRRIRDRELRSIVNSR